MALDERDPSTWNRRRVLAATVGLTVFAGCSSGDESDGTATSEPTNSSDAPGGPTETTAPAESPGSDSTDDSDGTNGSSDSGDDFAVTECPILPGTYTTFDPGTGPLPFSFEYPDVIDETPTPMDYANQETRTIVTGEYRRREDRPAEGDVFMDANVNLNPQQPRDTWYENRSDRETLLTTTINGSDVRFVATVPDMSFDDDRDGYSVMGLAPYDWGSARNSPTGTRESYHAVSMGILLSLGDDNAITASCAENLRRTLEHGVESIEMQSGVDLFEERV